MRRTNGRSSSFFVVALAIVVSACSGKSPTAPGPPTALSPPVSTTIGPVLSGESNAPVSGAPVQVAGQTVMTAGDGKAVVSSAVASGSNIDINATGFLPHSDWYMGQTFVLWPDRPGFDQNFTHWLVYGFSSTNPGQSTMQRIQGDVSIVPSAEFQTAICLAAFKRAADALTQANGKHTFSVVTDGNTTQTVMRIHPGSWSVAGPAICSDATTGRPYVCGADISIGVPPLDATFWIIVAHELGHAFGLAGHNPYDMRSIMSESRHSASGSRVDVEYTPEDKLAMRMMLQRCNGTQFPDNNRYYRADCTP